MAIALIERFNGKILKNIFHLGVLQAGNYLIPLVTIPYLVRVLGPDTFGMIAYISAAVGLAVILTDYGFNLSATKAISINREDKVRIDEIYSSVIVLKLGLMVVSFLLLLLLSFFVALLGDNRDVLLACFGMVIGRVILPEWLFHGLEKMSLVTYTNVLSKAIFAVLLFFVVEAEEDYIFAPLLSSFGYILGGVVSVILAHKVLRVNFIVPSKKRLRAQVEEGWSIFLSTVSMSVYTTSSVFVLGFFVSPAVVGYYAAAEKIIQAFKGVYVPVSRAVFPNVAKKVSVSKLDGLVFLKRISLIVLFIMGGLSIALFFGADIIVNVVLGDKYQDSVVLVKVMSLLPVFVALSNIAGIQTLLNFGFERIFRNILVAAAFFGMCLVGLSAINFGALGVAFAVVLVEFCVLFSMVFVVVKKVI